MNRNDEIEFIKAFLDRPIVLVGMMGVGKSHAGRKLAEALDLKFRDSDRLVEKRAGYEVAEIFEIFGEDKFRESERLSIAQALEKGPSVLATGGGAIMDAQTRENIRRHAISVWLKAGRDDLVARLSKSRNRPLLKNGDVGQIVDDLLRKRQPHYEQSDITVNVVRDSVPQTLDILIKTLYGYLKDASF